jgi:hypothetical protein
MVAHSGRAVVDAPQDPRAQVTGLRFSEVMAGPFALGADDPQAAAAQARDRFVLRATLVIDDIRGFLADSSHAGRLTGDVTFPALGRGLPVTAGHFNLFAPSSDPNVKLMVYVLSFAAGPEMYTFHGEKYVRRGSMLRGWPDTTTLHSRLYAGPEASGRVCGAGILRITAAGFARQLLSFRPVNGTGASARAGAMARFFTFFTRELLDSYL